MVHTDIGNNSIPVPGNIYWYIVLSAVHPTAVSTVRQRKGTAPFGDVVGIGVEYLCHAIVNHVGVQGQ